MSPPISWLGAMIPPMVRGTWPAGSPTLIGSPTVQPARLGTSGRYQAPLSPVSRLPDSTVMATSWLIASRIEGRDEALFTVDCRRC